MERKRERERERATRDLSAKTNKTRDNAPSNYVVVLHMARFGFGMRVDNEHIDDAGAVAIALKSKLFRSLNISFR